MVDEIKITNNQKIQIQIQSKKNKQNHEPTHIKYAHIYISIYV